MRLGDDRFPEGGASGKERSQPRGWMPAGRPSGVARLPSPPLPILTERGTAEDYHIFMELRADATYSPRDIGLPVSSWRTASGIEVDFILGNAEVAVEVKSTDRPASDHLEGLRAWQEEHPGSRCILVCRAPRPRRAEPAREGNPIVDSAG